MNPSRCVVLVPVGHHIEPRCEEGLRELERRGHPVRRVYGEAAIDAARSRMASSALKDGFDELFWVDADVAFDPDDVQKLRGYNLPFVCGVYAKRGKRGFACHFLPGTTKVEFGRAGGLTEVEYAGFGFVHTRREAYEKVGAGLPLVDGRWGEPWRPYFQPFVVPDGDGHRYLGEDYAFCQRLREAGIKVMADTSIRLWHVGSYPYSWEDAGSDKDRFASYGFRLS